MSTFGSTLRYLRLLRGWSQEELVHAVCNICQEGGKIPSLTTKTISRWENNKCKPSLYYQKWLCKLFNMTAQELGLLEEKQKPSAPLAH